MALQPTLLQMVNVICDELGLNRTSAVVNSTDTTIRQIYGLINRSLYELQQNFDWTFLQTEYDLYVAQPTTTTGDVSLTSYTIANIPNPPPTLLTTNPTLWIITGQYLPVNTRVQTYTGGVSTYSITVDQPATGTFTQAAIVLAQDTYPEPVDFSRFINQTWWDRTNRWALMGPDSPQIDQWHRSGIVTIGPRRHFRQIGYNGFIAGGSLNNYRIWPAPGATDTPLDLVFEYISSNIVLSSTGTPQPNFEADTDLPIIDANMLILDTKWRFWQIKGFDYMPMQMEAQDYINRRYAQDGGAKTLSLPAYKGGWALTTGIVQDGSWPGPGASGV